MDEFAHYDPDRGSVNFSLLAGLGGRVFKARAEDFQRVSFVKVGLAGDAAPYLFQTGSWTHFRHRFRVFDLRCFEAIRHA